VITKTDIIEGRFRYLSVLTVLNVTFQLISDVTAGKIIAVAGVGVSITVIYFPVTYIMGDVLTEVYGYARARYVVWLTLLASVLAGITYQIVAAIPPAPFFTANDAYVTVFHTVPRILVGGWLAVFFGDIANDYVLAKMKIWTKGRLLWARLLGSTVVGQGVNTIIFYVIGLYGILPGDVLVAGILMGWLLKSVVEIVMMPLTYIVVRRLKAAEGIDYYDYDTNFNPFIIRPDQPSDSKPIGQEVR
jgi:queuosine precursor transporter